MWRDEVVDGDGVFHSVAHAFVVVFRVNDICAVHGVWGVAAARGEYNVFVVQRVIGAGME
jgi:hypothetical protein